MRPTCSPIWATAPVWRCVRSPAGPTRGPRPWVRTVNNRTREAPPRALREPNRYGASESESPGGTMARIPALEPPFTPDVEAQLATMMPAGVPPIGLFRTFAKNLPMTMAMSNWGRYELGRDLTLTLREREVVILRTCVRCGCEYEWGVHLMVFANRAGLTPAEVTSLTRGSPDDPCWTAGREAMLIRMA